MLPTVSELASPVGRNVLRWLAYFVVRALALQLQEPQDLLNRPFDSRGDHRVLLLVRQIAQGPSLVEPGLPVVARPNLHSQFLVFVDAEDV